MTRRPPATTYMSHKIQTTQPPQLQTHSTLRQSHQQATQATTASRASFRESDLTNANPRAAARGVAKAPTAALPPPQSPRVQRVSVCVGCSSTSRPPPPPCVCVPVRLRNWDIGGNLWSGACASNGAWKVERRHAELHAASLCDATRGNFGAFTAPIAAERPLLFHPPPPKLYGPWP